MAFDFPSAPAVDQVFSDAVSGASYKWNGDAWAKLGSASATAPPGATGVEEAPLDSVPYARMNGDWVPADLMTADRPILNSVTPATAAAAAGVITLTLAGSKFSVTAKVYFGNELMLSHFVSPSSITFPFDPANHTVGPHAVTVNNQGLSSQPRSFTIT